MNHGLRNLVLAAASLASSPAGAASKNVCVPQAIGVPSRPGAPTWLNWTSSAGLVETDLDDPRWLGAAGHSVAIGSARAPLLSRMLWTNFGTDKYLMMSFIVDLEAIAGTGLTSPRDIFLGFRRKTALGTATPDKGDDEYGYIFQFHLDSEAAAGPMVVPSHCGALSSCDEISGSAKNFWRMYVDRDSSGSCTVGTVTTSGPSFLTFTGSETTEGAPIKWMTDPANAGQDSVRYWKLDSDNPLLQHRWAVQVRIKLTSGDSDTIDKGIPESSTFWYEGTAEFGTSAGEYGAVGWWPRDLTDSVCVKRASPNMIVHPQLGDAVSCAGSSNPTHCSVDNYRPFKLYSGTRPSDCEAGVFIDTPYIGSFPATSAFDATTDWPTNSFKAETTNVVVAQVVNMGATSVDVPLMARFRLAQWGSAPWIDPTQHGLWQDIPAAKNGVCGNGTAPPNCDPPPTFTVPAFADADHDGLADVRAPIKFNWKLGTDAKLGASEFCKYGLKPPDVTMGTTTTVGKCVAGCTCTAHDPDCDSGTGTAANIAPADVPTPCVSTRIEHQCMFVELSAPGGSVDFAQQSSWNNMNFDQLSTVSREALIDARQLPTKPGQTDQDIYLIAMARNMPATVPGGTADGGTFIREHILERAETVAAPYLADLDKLPPGQVSEISKRLYPAGPPNIAGPSHGNAAVLAGGDGGSKEFRERVARVARGLQIMPPKDAKLVTGLLTLVLSNLNTADLNQAVVHTVGPTEASNVIPTLEIYPFYRRFNEGLAYLPMTAFTVFLGHDGAMAGIDWRIDGADPVGKNVFHMRIPVGFARKLQVRAQAIQPPEQALAPGMPKWPCGGGCASCGGGANRNCGLVTMVGNGIPGVIAGVLVVRRRRKKPAKQAAASPAP